MLAYMFPGQGAQFRGMGKGLFDTVPLFNDCEYEVNRISGFSIRELCVNGPDSSLRKTEITQPCLFVVNALYFESERQEGREPKFVMGHSLGEYNALLAAGVFDFLTGLRLVTERGRLMSLAKNGTMAAVIGLDVERIREMLLLPGHEEVDLANLNTPNQTIISGPAAAIQNACKALERSGASSVIPLQVGGAFHSRYMLDAADEFGNFLEQFEFSPPKITVMANATGKPYSNSEGSRGIRELLKRQIASPVLWSECVTRLRHQGVTEFKEVGPSRILTRMVSQIPADLELEPASADNASFTNSRNRSRMFKRFQT